MDRQPGRLQSMGLQRSNFAHTHIGLILCESETTIFKDFKILKFLRFLIFGCAGPLLLSGLFSSCAEWGSSLAAVPWPLVRGFSHCRAPALAQGLRRGGAQSWGRSGVGALRRGGAQAWGHSGVVAHGLADPTAP